MKFHRQSFWFALAALAGLALVPYVQTFHFDFVNYDDNMYVTENRMVLKGLSWEGVTWAFTTFDTGNWHPLTWISHMMDCQMFGQRPGAHHLINVILHVFNSLLVFVTFRRMTVSTWRSALVAAVFAVHPIHVESVAWVSERKDVLSSLFGFLAISAYAAYAARGGAMRYAAVLVGMLLSLLCKPMFVTLPCLLLLLDIWPLRRIRLFGLDSPGNDDWMPGATPVSWSRAILEKAPLLLMSVACSIIAVISQHSSKTMSSLEAFPLSMRISNAMVAYVAYLWKLLFPVDLAAFYPHPGHWGALRVATAAAVLLAVTVAAVVQRRERPWLLIGWSWYICSLLPVIGLVQVGLQSMADRYCYLPSIGVLLMVVWSIPTPTMTAARQALAAAAVAILAALVSTAAVQASYWRDSRTLFNHALAVTRGNFIAHQNIGNALEKQGDLDAALVEYQEAARLGPRFPGIRENLATVLIRKGRYPEALEEIQIAMSLEPESCTAPNIMGVILLAGQQFDDAEVMFRRAVDCDPDNLEARGNHGVALLRLGQWSQAADELSRVARIYPERLGVRTNLARAWAGQGRASEAMEELREILKISPNFAPARSALDELARGGPASQP